MIGLATLQQYLQGFVLYGNVILAYEQMVGTSYIDTIASMRA